MCVKHLLLLLSLLLVSCAHLPGFHYTRVWPNQRVGEIITVRIDNNFSFEDKIAIDDAINSWNYALNNFIVFKVVSSDFDMQPEQIAAQERENGILIMKIDHTNYMVPPSHTGGDVLAFTNELGGRHIYVVRDLFGFDRYGFAYSSDTTELELKEVMMHELGHTLTVNHIEKQGSLMNAEVSIDYCQCIDRSTIEAVAQHFRLDVGLLNYCEYEP